MKKILTIDELKGIRKASGLSQKKFANRIGYSESYVRHLEKGIDPISWEFSKNVMKYVSRKKAYEKASEAYSDTQMRGNAWNGFFLLSCLLIFIVILIVDLLERN